MSVLELAEALIESRRDVTRTLQLLESLQKNLQQSVPSTSLRELVLRALYTHVDCSDERVLVAIARAMLTV